MTDQEEFEKDSDGICPECKEKTVKGEGYSCCFYASSCKTCGFALCDQSC